MRQIVTLFLWRTSDKHSWNLIFSLYGVLDNIRICPIAFNAFEELKAMVKWSKYRARWSKRMREIEIEGNVA